MDNKNGEELSLNRIIQQMRVPEFRYEADNTDSSDTETARLLDLFKTPPDSAESQSIVKQLRDEFNQAKLPAEFLNSAFFCDRLFDVWIRKSSMESELAEIVSSWRFPFMRKFYADSHVSPQWFNLLDSIDLFATEWSGENQRSRNAVLDIFTEIKLALFSASPLSEDVLDTICARWHTHEVQQNQRRSKVVSRLVELEEKLALDRYVSAEAVDKLNTTFAGHTLPTSLISILNSGWQATLSNIYRADSHEDTEEANSINKKLLLTFTQKGNYAFKFAPTLVEEMSKLAEKFGVDIEDSHWSLLDASIVNLLQEQPFEEKTFNAISTEAYEDVLVSEEPAFAVGDLFADEKGLRFKVAEIFKETNQTISVNALGIKYAVDSIPAFNTKLRSGSIKRLDTSENFSAIYHQTHTGLERVLNNQIKARQNAARKAQLEAEALQEQKNKADELAKLKAAQIAEKTKNLKTKRSEQKYLRDKKAAFDALSNLKLGAWISLRTGEETLRYKLAVKFAATSKYIFVDRYGLKKIEYKEDELTDVIARGDIKILNDGADFDASLERVVSRIRISK